MGLPEVVGTVQQVHCSQRRLLRWGLEFHVCTINKSAHTKKSLETYLMMYNNSIKHQSFVYTQLNDQTVLFQTIQFTKSHLFALSLNVKQFYLTHR